MTLAWTLGLASVRLWALLRVQASWRALVGPTWEAIAIGLAFALALVGWLGLPSELELPDSIAAGLVVVALEFMLGSVIGLIASLPGWALCGAAEVSEVELAGTGRPRSLAALLIALALAAALGLGLHRPLLGELIASLRTLPLGDPSAWAAAAASALDHLPLLLLEFTALALALATPVLLIRLVVDVGVVALGGGPNPAASVFAGVTPGLRFAAAALALAASWSAHPQAWAAGLG